MSASAAVRPQFRWRALALMLVLAGCSSEAERTSEFDHIDSPQGAYRLVALVITPRFPQGPHQVVLEVETLATHARQRVLQTELAWDGVPFTHRNIALRWTTPSSAVVCLSATDRPDKAVRIAVDNEGKALAELKDGC